MDVYIINKGDVLPCTGVLRLPPLRNVGGSGPVPPREGHRAGCAGGRLWLRCGRLRPTPPPRGGVVERPLALDEQRYRAVF